VHGDYHLGQVMRTQTGWVVLDFEGEPASPLAQRRARSSPLRDVAGMLRSFDYVSYLALFKQVELGAIHESQFKQVEPWTSFWVRWVSAAFLRGYLHIAEHTDLLPPIPEHLEVLLDAHVLEKAIFELGYELRHRPDCVKIPLRGILQMLEPKSSASSQS